jgi:BBSome-interacting protein 1
MQVESKEGSLEDRAGDRDRPVISEIFPKSGLVFSERDHLTEVLCKPKIIPLKSAVLEKLEKLERKTVENQS